MASTAATCSGGSPSASIIKIISATYGPCKGRRLFNGDVANNSSSIPFTRDVLLQLTKLLENETERGHEESGANTEDVESPSMESSHRSHRQQRRRRVAIPAMDGKAMNAEFGDVAPGTTKILKVSYMFRDDMKICRASFREHERVVLRRSEPLYHNSIEESQVKRSSGNYPISHKAVIDPSTSEVAVPLFLPYLEIRQRAMCQLVCKCWRFVVREVGVATIIDVNDPGFPNFTRSVFLRGIMAHSYTSLTSLILNDFTKLSRKDLHPAIPHMRKLQALDISRCTQLDDSTLNLVSENLGDTLEILYMKGLPRVSDKGLIAICKSCSHLRVLEISNIDITDDAGAAIADSLLKLQALYMRDNYRLTNASIDRILTNCTKLEMVTLWGCTKLQSTLRIGELEKICLLNLWGCFGLSDDIAGAIGRMKYLRSLIVSECHNLTDKFVVGISGKMQYLQHLNLRYLRRISSESVFAVANDMLGLETIDLSFCTKIDLHSLVHLLESAPSLTELRVLSCNQIDVTIPRPRNDEMLSEYSRGHAAARGPEIDGAAGRLLSNAIKSRSTRKSRVCVLDVRKCVGRHRHHNAVRGVDTTFSRCMNKLGFEQKLDLFFCRQR